MRKSLGSPQQQRLAALLRTIREEQGLDQIDVAKRLRVSQSSVSHYESGQRRIDLLELEQICEAIGTPLLEFIRRFKSGRR
jgi:transcriptional regulator with XRE-family HTH domain